MAIFSVAASANAANQIGDYVGMALTGATAEGELGGKMAHDISTMTHSTDPVFVRLSKISSLAGTAGCGRVGLRIRQRVPTTDGRQAEWEQAMELNICENGQPPEQGAELRQLPPSVRLLDN